jgi:hypothetical protein
VGLLFYGFELFDEVFELGAGSIAEQEDLDAEGAVGGDAADYALDKKGEMADFETKIEALAYGVAGGLVGLDEAAFEREVQDLAGKGVPVLHTKFDGAITGIATRLSCFDVSIH